jgi:hypothetical protein
MEVDCRKVVAKSVRDKTVGKETIVALVVLLIIQCAFRIGSKKPSSSQGNRGIFYITREHLEVHRDHVSIDFIGKWNKRNECQLEDHEVATLLDRFLKRVKDKHAFIFKNKTLPAASPADVRAFLKKHAPKGKESIFSPKSFRNVVIHTRLFHRIRKWVRRDMEKPERLRRLNAAIEENAIFAYHSASMQKRSYLNPDIVDLIVEGDKQTRKIFANKDALEVYVELLERVCD